MTKKNIINNIININNNKENQNLNDNINDNNNENNNSIKNNNKNNLILTLPKITNNNIINQKQFKLKNQIKDENSDLNSNYNIIIEKNNEYEKTIPKTLSSIENTNYNLKNNSDNNSETNMNKNNNKKCDSGTQTEEIFFKMPWTYFAGSYKIISSKVKNINLNKTMVPHILLQKFGIQNKKQTKSYRNGFYQSNFGFNNNYYDYNKKNNNDLDTKNLMNILTFASFDNKRNHKDNLYYNSLTEKNKNKLICENPNMKSMEIKKK